MECILRPNFFQVQGVPEQTNEDEAADESQEQTPSASAKKTTQKKPPPKRKVREATPRTPKRKEKTPTKTMSKKMEAIVQLKPGERSPTKMKNGNHCIDCDHGDHLSLRVCDPKYFGKAYVHYENYPNNCAECEKGLFPGPNRCTIDVNNPVHACWNAVNHREHPCQFALCHPCWVDTSGKGEVQGRKRKRRKLYSPSK